MKIGFATSIEKAGLTPDDQILARELVARGTQVIPFIWNRDNLLGFPFDAVVIRSIWDYYKHPAKFSTWLDRLEAVSIPVINCVPVIRGNTDKAYLLDLKEKAVPSLLIARDGLSHADVDKIRAQGWGEIVVKPTISASGFLTQRMKAMQNSLFDTLTAIAAHSDVLVQPFLKTVETEGEVSLIFFRLTNPVFSHAIRKTPKKGDFRVQGDHGGREEPFIPSAALLEFGSEVMKSVTGDWTYARVDVLNWATKPLIGEIEMIEPDLFLRHRAGAIQDFAGLLIQKLEHLQSAQSDSP